MNQERQIEAGKLAALGELVGSVSHDLNNPLAVLLNTVESLIPMLEEETPDIALVKELARYLSISSQRLSKVSQHLKSLVLHSVSPYDLMERSLKELVEGAVQVTEHYTKKAGLEITVQIPDDLPKVTVIPAMIEQVVINLIRNSYEEMRDRGQGKLELSGRSDPSSGRIVLRVSDNGQGIAPSAQPRLLCPFTTTKGSGRGTGLGLYTAAKLAELHEGSLTQVPSPAQGAAFELTLPPKPLLAEEPPPGLRGKRILVCHPVAGLRESLARSIGPLTGVPVEERDPSAGAWSSKPAELALVEASLADAAAGTAGLAARIVRITEDESRLEEALPRAYTLSLLVSRIEAALR